jgi:hypothetical protein
LDDDGGFPSESKEKLGRWVGIAENVGDVLTWFVLTEDTKRVIPRSVIRSANNPQELNLRAMPIQDDPLEILDGPEPGSISHIPPAFQTIYSVADQLPNQTVHLPRFSVEELIGRTFLLDRENGLRLRAEIIRKIDDQDARNHTNIKLLCKVGDDEAEKILGYQELCDLIAKQDDEELDGNKFWTFKKVLSHTGSLNSSHPDWKGSKFNVKVLWEDNSITEEPLQALVKDDPVTLAEYAQANNLLDVPGWYHLRHIVKNQKKFGRLVKQAKLKSIRRAPVFRFGVQAPRNSAEARQLDEKNKNTRWQDAEKAELESLYS